MFNLSLVHGIGVDQRNECRNNSFHTLQALFLNDFSNQVKQKLIFAINRQSISISSCAELLEAFCGL